MAAPTKDQIVALGRLTPPIDPVSENELLDFVTGLAAIMEFGPEILAVLDDADPLYAIAKHVTDVREAAGGEAATGNLVAGNNQITPIDPRDQQIRQLQDQIAQLQNVQLQAAQDPHAAAAAGEPAAPPVDPASPVDPSTDAPPAEGETKPE